MTTRLISIGLTLAICAGAPAAFADASVSPGKSSAYVSVSNVAFPLSGFTGQASVQILKGKKKRVLEVDVTAIDQGLAVSVIGIHTTVNGIALLEPNSSTFQVAHGCVNTFVSCVGHAMYWLDLDAAEAANPGMFINVPLDIVANVVVGGAASTGTVSVRARLVKK